METRFQAGNFLTAAFATFSPDERSAIETVILSLSGPGSNTSKKVLAGCLDAADCVTEKMRAFKLDLKSDTEAPSNRPAMQFNFRSQAYDTDAYLADLGINVADPDSVEVRDLMRPVEALPNAWDPNISLDKARQRLDAIDPLVDRLVTLSQGQIAPKLYEHAAGTAAEAAHRVANASYDVIQQPEVNDRLKRIFLFAKGSTFPAFSQEHEENFHSDASWSGPSARNHAAGGLMALARPQNPLDSDVRDAIRELAQDPVCDVRMQIVQKLYILRKSDPAWMWDEIERVVQHEYTRTVVGSAIESLAGVAHLNIPQAIRIAKVVLSRYVGQEGAGIGKVCQSAASLIMDVHFSFSDSEADQFYAEQLADPSGSSENLQLWVVRYSDNLGKGDDTGSADDQLRAKTIAFYRECATYVSDELASLYTQHDLAKSGEWPSGELARAQALNGVLDDMALRVYFASGGKSHSELNPAEKARRWRLYRELAPVLDRLAECSVVHTAYYLIQGLENFIPADPAAVFRLIVKSVMSAAKFGYAFESMGANVVVRIIEEYLADHRDVFNDEARLNELMDLLNLFVNAGWPAAQSLTFRLAEIWR